MNKQATEKKTSVNSRSRTHRMVITAMLAALSAALMFIEIPMPFIAPDFYKLDFSEIPALIGGFALGPLSAAVIELVKILLKFVIKGTIKGGVGELANFAVGCALVMPAAFIYKYRKTRAGALIGMCAGTLIMTVFGAVINGYVLLPAYAAAFHMDISALVDMGRQINSNIDSVFKFCLIAVSPFNLIKGTVVSLITFFIYKPLSRIIHNNL